MRLRIESRTQPVWPTACAPTRFRKRIPLRDPWAALVGGQPPKLLSRPLAPEVASPRRDPGSQGVPVALESAGLLKRSRSF